MTTSHALQDCPLREALRKDIWPNSVNLQNQLYGDRVDMQRITSGIDCLEKVNAMKKKKKTHIFGLEKESRCRLDSKLVVTFATNHQAWTPNTNIYP
jgi:hypothetical protein